LLLQPNTVITAERLIDAIWGDEPPATARNTLQTYVRHLRKALGSDRIQHRSSGYVFSASTTEVDAFRFEALVDQARGLASADASGAAGILQEALRLWRGPALDDLADQASLRSNIARLEELRLAATEDRIGAELAVGRHRELVPELRTLVERHPLRERLWAYLMVALYRSSRQGDALAAYRHARGTLRKELGIDPSPELQHLFERILRQDAGLELSGVPLRGYRLLERIGHGAFGVVWRAYQPQVGREVAVKMIRPEFADHPEFIRRFDAEAQLVARLEHPHVVPLYDYWREPVGAYLVMRFLRGGSLRDALAHGPLEVDRAVRLIDEVSLALAAAHRQGVVHGDVKPANVLFDEEGNAYLSDFALAKDAATKSPATLGGPPTGLADYLSPEEALGEPVTTRADLYGLGLLIYESLAGRHPFAETPPQALIEKHARESVPPLRSIRRDLPAAVDEVIARATAKSPAARYPDARSLAIAVRNALMPTPVRPAPAEPLQRRNPYKGLRPFLEADATDFFGREALTERLLDRMREDGEGFRFLAVVGPSGSGKSSLVRAGLLPALRRGALQGSDRWFAVDMIPGTRPFEELDAALMRIAVDPSPGFAGRLQQGERGLVLLADAILPPDGSELLLVIDQFEEIFSLVQDEDLRPRFLGLLAAASTDPWSRVRVVVTLRGDFYDRPLCYKGFGDLLAARTEAVTPLSLEELGRAVSRPAEAVGLAVDPQVVVEIVTEVADQPSALPLFQYALTELFEQQKDSTVSAETYREVGGVSGALARRAEDLYGGLNEVGREATRNLLLRLVAIGEDGSKDTRRRVQRVELASLDVDREATEAVIDAFAAHRLLSFDRDPVTRAPTVEFAHEALLTEWARLREWVDQAREDLRTERRLAVAAREWVDAGRELSFVAVGSRLERFETWRQSSNLAITPEEHDFLDASLAERDRRADEEARSARERALERRSVTRLRALVALGLLAAAASMSGLLLSSPDEGLGRVGPNTLARIELDDGEVAGGIPVGLWPTGVAVGQDAVWVANQDSGTVSVVDPVTNQVFDLGSRGRPTAIAVGEDAVWVVNAFDGIVTRIDPNTNAAQTVALRPGVEGLAVGAGSVWVTNAVEGVLTRIDPQSLRTEGFRIGGRPGAVALGGGFLWIADGEPDGVIRVDPLSGEMRGRIDLRVKPTQVAVGEGGVWVTSRLSDTVIRIDPSTLTVAATIRVGNEPTGIGVGAGAVWVTNAADGTVVRIEPSRNVVTNRIRLGASPEGVAVGADAIWVAVRDG
jgi:YVTN family beta-propeller protein